MAVSFTTDMSRAESLYNDYPENILVVPELNGRHENTDVESLAADIEANGQIEPILIRKDDQGKPVLVAGHRRWRAFLLLNERNPDTPRKIACKYVAVSEAGAFVLTISENRFRRDVSPIDDAVNIQTLMSKFGKTEEDIAKIYFPEANTEESRSEAAKFVKQRIALIELAPEAAQAVRQGRIKITAAVALSKLSREQQKAKVAGEGKVKVHDVTPKSKTAVPSTGTLHTFSELAVSLAQQALEDHTDWDKLLSTAKKVLRLAKSVGIEVPEAVEA